MTDATQLSKRDRYNEKRRQARIDARKQGILLESDKNTEKNRVIFQTVNGGKTHIRKIDELGITLNDISNYCSEHNVPINNVLPYLLTYLQTKKTDTTYDNIFNLHSFSELANSATTAKIYFSNICSLKILLKTETNYDFINEIFLHCDTVVQKITEKYENNAGTYLSCILFLLKNFKFNFDNNITIINFYSNAIKQNSSKYSHLLYEKHEGIIPWSDIVRMRTEISPDERFGFRHLLLSLYTCVPPLRDDYGNIKIIDSDNQNNGSENYYCTSSSIFYINQYKTRKIYGAIVFKTPQLLTNIIINSIKLSPRSYLLTHENNTTNIPFQSGLSATFRKLFPIGISEEYLTINHIRHSFETYISQFHINFDQLEIKKINNIIGHNSEQRDMYVRNKIKSQSLFKKNIENDSNIIQTISDKIGGFYDIGDTVD